MIKLKNDGYVFISKNGIEYDLLEFEERHNLKENQWL